MLKQRQAVDDKILTAWNALMIRGYSDAWRVFGNPEFLNAVRTNADFILNKMMSADGRLYRNYNDGKYSVMARDLFILGTYYDNEDYIRK